ncbi:MAG: DUF1844 domain-containing protein [Desulfobacterales bacterium]
MAEEKKDSPKQDRSSSAETKAGGEQRAAAGPDIQEKRPPHEGPPLPAMDFSTFILSLNQSAFVHLGIVDDPASGQKNKQLVLAKQTIDLLGMLEEKTRGNLTAEESGMLKNILYDLRIIYVREKA